MTFRGYQQRCTDTASASASMHQHLRDVGAMQLDEPITFRNRARKAARYIVVLASQRPRTTRV